MTRKDYRSIAKILKDNSYNGCPLDGEVPYEEIDRDSLINDFVIMFKKDNSRFDKERFVNACK